MEGLKKDYGKSTLTLDLAPFDTYFRIATYRLDNESTDNLLAAIDCIESPESSKFLHQQNTLLSNWHLPRVFTHFSAFREREFPFSQQLFFALLLL